MISLVLVFANILSITKLAESASDEASGYLVSTGDILSYADTEKWLTSIRVCYTMFFHTNFTIIISVLYLFSLLTKN